MEWLFFSIAAPVVPVLMMVGVWAWMRPATPARGVGGLSCDARRI